jgi:hypothetical protein
MNIPSESPKNPTALPAGEILHSDQHSHLTVTDIARAVERHKREHPEQFARKTSPQKTTPRR